MKRLTKLQQGLQRWNQNESDSPVNYLARVTSFPLKDGIHLSYWGPYSDDEGEPFDMFLEALTDSQLAEQIVSLEIDGPDEGANGSQEWCFSRWLSQPTRFTCLKHFGVRLSDAADHNLSFISARDATLDENGEIGLLLSHMPEIESLQLPSTPSQNFFELKLPKLTHMRVQSAGGPKEFISRLAKSDLRLKKLDFTDCADAFDLSGSSEPTWGFTAAADYAALVTSPAMRSAYSLVLRNARLLEADYRDLQTLNPHCAIQVVVEPPAQYVSHWNPNGFPFRHLLWADHILNRETP